MATKPKKSKTTNSKTKKKETKSKVAKKPSEKVSKENVKKITKTADKNAKAKTSKPKVSKTKLKITRFKFSISGYGSELAWQDLDKKQFKYWRKVYDKSEDEYDAQRQLIDHLRHEKDPKWGEPGFLGFYASDFDEINEYPFYEGSKLKVELFSGDDFVEEIEIDLTDNRIQKSFFDGYIEKTEEKDKYTSGVVFVKTEDRGGYCIGEWDLQDDEEFSLEKFEVSVETIQGYQYVSRLDYDDNFIENEVYPDNYNKDFDAWIIWS